MEYSSVEDAKRSDGLRIALTKGVPGPWSQAAKYLFEFKGLPFIAVEQKGGRDNPELFEWTGHRNAPVVVYNNEPPRTGWHEIIMLAERIKPEPALVPVDPSARANMFGLISEMASEGGMAWQRRLRLIEILYTSASDDHRARRGPDTLAARYGYSPSLAEDAENKCRSILEMLSANLKNQAVRGSEYFIGDSFTAVDLYWACFSQLVEPMSEENNPMPPLLRTAYELPESLSIDPVLITHRNMIYKRHLSLPLDF